MPRWRGGGHSYKKTPWPTLGAQLPALRGKHGRVLRYRQDEPATLGSFKKSVEEASVEWWTEQHDRAMKSLRALPQGSARIPIVVKEVARTGEGLRMALKAQALSRGNKP